MDKLINKVKRNDSVASKALKKSAMDTKVLLKADKKQDKKLDKFENKKR